MGSLIVHVTALSRAQCCSNNADTNIADSAPDTAWDMALAAWKLAGTGPVHCSRLAGHPRTCVRRIRSSLRPIRAQAFKVEEVADKRDQELYKRKMYLTNCWYSLALSKNVPPGKTTPIEVCGQRLLLSRAEDGSLTTSRWRVQERGGLVWVFVGDAPEPPPIFAPEQYGREGWEHVYDELEMKANHWMVFENVIDMAHVPVIHKSSTNDTFHSLPDLKVEVDEEHNAIKFVFPILREPLLPPVDGFACAVLPSNSFIEFRLPFGLRYIVFGTVMPVNETTSVVRFCSVRNILPWKLFNPVFARAMRIVLSEDKDILERLRPDDTDVEFSVAFDGPQLAFRKMRMKFIDRGWALKP